MGCGRRGLGLLTVGWTLACSGVAPPDGPSEQQAGSPALLALGEDGGACSWQVWQLPAGLREVWQTDGACPGEVLWDPSGEAMVVRVGDAASIVPWQVKGEAVAVPLPELEGEVSGPWVAADSGLLRAAVLLEATVSDDGVFAAGELSAGTVATEEGAEYGVRGTTVVAPGAGDRDVWLPPWGLDGLVVVFERDGSSGDWRRLAVLPTRYAAGDTPGIDVGADLLAPAAWTRLSALRTSCSSGVACEAPVEWNERAELTEAVQLEEGDALGFLPGGDGGWLFKVVWGDTPHAFGPVLGCDDPDCTQRTALAGVPDGQLTVDARGGFVLIADEYSQTAPRVYAAGRAEPVLELPGPTAGVWLPESGLPGLD